MLLWLNGSGTSGSSFLKGELGVRDGQVASGFIETSKVILESPTLRENETLTEKAYKYLDIVKVVIDRYHKAWTWISENQGYYWDTPQENTKNSNPLGWWLPIRHL